MQPRALEPQPQRFPMDAGDDLQRQQRIGDEQAQQPGVGQRRAVRVEPGMQHRGAVGLMHADADGQRLARRLDAEAVVHRHAEEGRHVQPLVAALLDQRRGALGRIDFDQVAVPLAEGVVDFVEDRQRRAIRRVAEPHAQRIEGVAEQARHRQQPDRATGGKAGRRELRIDPRAQPGHVAGAAVAVVRRPEAEEVEPPQREPAQPRIERRQLVQVQQQREHPVAQPMTQRSQPLVHHPAEVERGGARGARAV